MTDLSLGQPLSIWMQLGSLCFTLAGLHGDVLVIRLFLVAAYLFLLLQTLLRGPQWPDVFNSDSSTLSLDALLWSVLNLYVHGTALALLLADERRVRALTPDQRALWRLFYRAGGMSERLFHELVVVRGRVALVECAAGARLPTRQYVYILYAGRVAMRVRHAASGATLVRAVGRGELFDFKHLGMLSRSKYFHETSIRCEAQTAAKLFRFRRDDLRRIVDHPLSKVVWQSLLINNLSHAVAQARQRRAPGPGGGEGALGVWPDADDDLGDPFAPLRAWEAPDPTVAGSGTALRAPLRHIWRSLRHSGHWPWPGGRTTPGLRQAQLAAPGAGPPPAGISDGEGEGDDDDDDDESASA